MDRSVYEQGKLRVRLFVPKLSPTDRVDPKPSVPRNSWDWRTTDKVTPAKSQGLCGSCWAFAAAAAIESKLLIQFNKTYEQYPVDLSEQHLIDCASGGVRTGCSGGNFEDPLFYVSK